MLRNSAAKLEVLIPIRLDIETDSVKIRDTFTWNLNGNSIDNYHNLARWQPFITISSVETDISVDYFSRRMCFDLKISERQFAPLISKCIQDQINDVSAFIDTSSMTENTRLVIKVCFFSLLCQVG
jgi:hypothetical protein